VRYSFHGKVRTNGQQVDGFVEAANATEAIDRLADRGIIGVYSVRPEARPVKNAVTLSGEAEPEEPRQEPRRLPSPSSQRSQVVPKRIPPATAKPAVAARPAPQQQIVAPAPAAAEPVAAPVAVNPATESALLQMMERLTALMGRVEQALSRPAVMYQAGPVRAGGFSPAKKSGKIPMDVQSSTLHDIFKNNLDLRKSLDKLATTVGTAPAKGIPVRELAARDGEAKHGGFIDAASSIDRETGDGGTHGGGAIEDGIATNLAPASLAPASLAPASLSNSATSVFSAPREASNGRETSREMPKTLREPAAVIAQKLAV
jgi:hypothetical protein